MQNINVNASGTSVGRKQCSGYISLIANFNPEEGKGARPPKRWFPTTKLHGSQIYIQLGSNFVRLKHDSSYKNCYITVTTSSCKVAGAWSWTLISI